MRQNLRKGNITLMAQIIAVLTMVVSLYVPHHHHDDSICIGAYDCKGSERHSHHDDCGGKESNDVCCLSEGYIDSRDADDDQLDWSAKAYNNIADVICALIHVDAASDDDGLVAFLPQPYVVPVVGLEALRSPPCVDL